MAGPLPIQSENAISPLSFPYNSGRSSSRTYTPDEKAITQWYENITREADDIISDLWRLQTPAFGSSKSVLETYIVASNDQVTLEDGHVMKWVAYVRKGFASTILPQGVYFKADTTGRNPENWRVVMWLYNGVIYADIHEFRAAWSSSTFEKIPLNSEGVWTTIEPPPMPDSWEYSNNSPPEFQQIGGSRIAVDRDDSFVSWMGFSFNFAFSQVNGIALYDIRLDGERIFDELSLQEALAYYAGNDLIQSSTTFFDSLFGLGTTTSELIPGYDCLAYAEFFDTYHFRGEKAHRKSGTACLFEAPSEYPTQRHRRGATVTSYTSFILIFRLLLQWETMVI